MKKTILVNKDNHIKDNYFNKVKLIETKDIDGINLEVEEETLNAFIDLKIFLKTKGIEIGIDSAYRSIERQQELYDEFEKKYGKEYCEKYVAQPRTSEHHTGLAIDFNIMVDGKYLFDNDECFKNTHLFENIHKYLKDFGFILRYPPKKEDITGYSYEPWHIRYVGKIPAQIIWNNNWTLEEYLTDFSSLIAINKNKGVTSFDVVNDISHIFGIKRVGHTGTLDPLAEGVLIVAIGKATKVVELVTSSYKEYIAEAILGIQTDTLDITGNILDKKDITSNLNVEDVIKSYQKTYLQEVPIYSAVKVNGKKLYEYARNNEHVDLPKKEVTIKEIDLLDYHDNLITFRTLVSKGTYIRSLINDIGNSLGTLATMTKLTRTQQANISIENTNTIEDIKENKYKLYQIDEILDYPIIEVDKQLEKAISNGRKIPNIFNIEDKVIFKLNNKILGIYEKENEELKVWKNF